MTVDRVTPWETPEWDAYVREHPGGCVYHTSAWVRIVADAGRYGSACMVSRDGGRVTGLLPIMHIRSRLTGDRVTSLPFSDACYPIADDIATARALVDAARALRETTRAGFYEMRGVPILRTGEPAPAGGDFGAQSHFSNYIIPLSEDTEAVRMTFARKAVRQSISKSERLGVSVRTGSGNADLDTFYSLYVKNRRRHGIPPQPRKLFASILGKLTNEPRATLYLAEFEGRAAAALITLHYKGVTYAKYEGVDESYRRILPIYPLFWSTIADAARRGDRAYDFGRTADDNVGLGEFKGRWGTTREPMPYFFSPPGEGVSVVRSDSLKYRVFTAVFRNLPTSLATQIGARIFRHFG